MAMYTTRIEILTQQSNEIYNELNQAMEAAGFFRTIQLTAESAVYELPAGEYNWIGEMNAAIVLEAAVNATAQICKKVRVLVSKADGIGQWHIPKQVN